MKFLNELRRIWIFLEACKVACKAYLEYFLFGTSLPLVWDVVPGADKEALWSACWSLALDVAGLNAMQLQNLAALAAAASAAQSTPSGTNALTTSSSPLSVLTSSGKHVAGLGGALVCLRIPRDEYVILRAIKTHFQRGQIMNNKFSNAIF